MDAQVTVTVDPSVVVETVERCYRILDGKSGAGLDDPFTHGRFTGYTTTLALLLHVPTREVERRLQAREL